MTVTAPNPIQNPKTTWKQVFSTGDDVVGLNTIHPQVVKLLSAESKDELTDSAQKDIPVRTYVRSCALWTWGPTVCLWSLCL